MWNSQVCCTADWNLVSPVGSLSLIIGRAEAEIMVLKIFFPQCCNLADSGLLVGRWISGHNSAVVLAVIHYPFIPSQVKTYLQQVGAPSCPGSLTPQKFSVPQLSSVPSVQMQAQSGVELSVLGSWSLPKEGQEGMESFLRDLSTIFPQERWLQIHREVGKTGFNCRVVHRDQRRTLASLQKDVGEWECSMCFQQIKKIILIQITLIMIMTS